MEVVGPLSTEGDASVSWVRYGLLPLANTLGELFEIEVIGPLSTEGDASVSCVTADTCRQRACRGNGGCEYTEQGYERKRQRETERGRERERAAIHGRRCERIMGEIRFTASCHGPCLNTLGEHRKLLKLNTVRPLPEHCLEHRRVKAPA
jgi:hypothetical protein